MNIAVCIMNNSIAAVIGRANSIVSSREVALDISAISNGNVSDEQKMNIN